MFGAARTRRRLVAAAALTAVVVSAAPVTQAATPPPLFFSVRLEGVALRTSGTVQARTLDPGTGYSFAKIDSTAALDGTRALQMKAAGSTNDPGNLGGAALFAPGGPTNGTSSFPNFSEAFFPAFEEVGQSTVAEKCALNAESKEAPECRDQPGPYALARVVPDADAPTAEGFARNAGADGLGGDSTTISRVTPTESGTLEGVQRNEGRNLGIPDTPIVVESFVTASKISATRDGVTGEAECSARVSVGGEAVVSNEELQAVLGPLSGTAVEYHPPTETVIAETFGGTKEISCTGARFIVTGPDATVEYTFGQTFATASPPSDIPTFGSGSVGGLVGGPISSTGTLSRSPAPSVLGSGAGSFAGDTTSTAAAPSPAGGGAPTGGGATAPGTGTIQGGQVPELVRTSIDTLPIAITTALAASVLPLGVVLLWAVVGSLARGLPTLRFPPFRD